MTIIKAFVQLRDLHKQLQDDMKIHKNEKGKKKHVSIQKNEKDRTMPIEAKRKNAAV
jgi:hypothetical protein